MTTIIMNDAHSYATRKRAEQQLHAAVLTMDQAMARGFVIVNEKGRFVPTVLQSSIDSSKLLGFVNMKVAVVG